MVCCVIISLEVIFVCDRLMYHPDLKGIGGGNLSYDFYIELGDGRSWLIEYQGGQHYFPVSIFGGDFGFEKQQEHDRRKREYAINLGIDLIEIPYNMDTYESISIFLKSHGIEYFLCKNSSSL